MLKNLSVVVLDIRLPRSSSSRGLIKINQPILYSHLYCTTNQQNIAPVDLRGSSYRYSQHDNQFVAGGGDTRALMDIQDAPGVVIECKSSRGGNRTLGFYQCRTGIGCCTTSITDDIAKYRVEFKTLKGKAIAPGDAECRSAFLVEGLWWHRAKLNSLPPHVPVMLEWAITPYEEDLLIKQSNRRGNDNSGSCQPYLMHKLEVLVCSCNQGYRGNYFLPQGCQDVDEFKEDPNITCRGKCVNRLGSYYCKDNKTITIIGTSASVGAIVLLLLSWWSYKFIKRRHAAKLKQKFFKRNGGLVLQQRLSYVENNHMAKGNLFTSTELDMAADHYNESRILGQGGQGTVYKGMLTDGTIVAVKKSKVVILSEINHKNVVKLLGLCLESEVPLLVYEFVSNGTLYQYLHDPCGGFPMSWETRLRIANEIAGALSYLHFAAAIPIYHCDIKLLNILLDKNYQAKVADFGASRSITIDQTHLTTKVQGTVGYLDPEYFQTSQFMDKSDVYSFAVVLVELLTGEKPISQLRAEEGRSLATYFIIVMEENHLFDVLDKEVLNNGEKEDIIVVSNLVKRCLNLSGRYRLTIKEVAMELERVRSLRNHVVVWQNDEEIDCIITRSICPLGAVSTLTRSEADVELTLLEDDWSLFNDLPR
ncbi:hypothetical protein BT93_E2170 [Corymbia citriodora subsp. variegata]|nr:hypothetical protein BT93_E2170 [Corymbia citriodora subsp. variegata]